MGEQSILFNKEDVCKFLPHRDPFLFIDYVENIDFPGREEFIKNHKSPMPKDLIGGYSVCHYCPPKEHPIFMGHFPQNPILPGVIQVEMMAQASSFLLLEYKNRQLENLNVNTTLLGVDQSRFKKPIYPLMPLVIRAELKRVRGWIMCYDVTITSQNVLCSQCSILASINFNDNITR